MLGWRRRTLEPAGSTNVAAVTTRMLEPVPIDHNGENIIPFVRPNRGGMRDDAPEVCFAVGERPAPPWHTGADRARLAALLAGSLLLHGALYAAFNREPPPMAGLGQDAITGEIVVG